MIRGATEADINDIIPLAEQFLDESPMGSKTTIDRNSLKTFLSVNLDTEISKVWVMDKGGIVGMSAMLIFPFYANPSYLIAQELFWFVEKAHRGGGKQLLIKMQEWAKSKKVDSMHMISLETKTVDLMDRYYKREGYTPIEHTYSKEF